MVKTFPPSHHYDGKRYQNSEHKPGSRHIRDLMRWLLGRKPSKWPKKIKIEPRQVPYQRVGKGKLQITFINHSTVLLQLDNLNILTDPIWSKRCGPFGWIGLKRVAAPGIRFEDLPPIDLVLVSHNHYDHMDIPTLRRLEEVYHPTFCVSKGNKRRLEQKGLKNVHEMDWWQQHTVFEDLKIHCVPAQHFSRRGLMDRNKTLWCGFVLESSKGPIYFAGDTGYCSQFKQLYKKFGPMRFSLLPIGAYTPEWFMSTVHMSPDDAVKAHLDLHSKQSMAIHFGTFHLSDEAIDQPIKDLVKALSHYKVSATQFQVLLSGESCTVL